MPSSNNDRRDMSLFGISDTELLAVVDDLADENGWSATLDIRLQLGEDPATKYSGVPQRLAWMCRYGWLERNREARAHRLTAMGHAILDNPKLSASVQKALDKANAAQRIRLVRELGEEAADGPMEIHSAIRRQFRRAIRR